LVDVEERLFPVGRLDMDSEGLLLLTNDGDLAQRLSHPRYGHSKTYLVLVGRAPGTASLARLRKGIPLEEGRTAPSKWRVLDKPPDIFQTTDPAPQEGVWLQVTMRQGLKRQIRRMAAAEHLTVQRLIRVSLGPLQLDRRLKPGDCRPLSRRELQTLRAAVRRRRPSRQRRPFRRRSR
jgi:pseudouridine synthase